MKKLFTQEEKDMLIDEVIGELQGKLNLIIKETLEYDKLYYDVTEGKDKLKKACTILGKKGNELQGLKYREIKAIYDQLMKSHITIEVEKEEDKNAFLMEVKVEYYDFQGLLEKIRESFKNKISNSYNPILLQRNTTWEISYESSEEVMSKEYIFKYLQGKNRGVYIDFAYYDMELDKVALCNGKAIEENENDFGHMKFYEDNAYGMLIRLIEGKLKFYEVQCVYRSSIKCIEHGGRLTEEMENFIRSFIK